MVRPEKILRGYLKEINSMLPNDNDAINKELLFTRNLFASAIMLIENYKSIAEFEQVKWNKNWYDLKQIRKLAKKRLGVIAGKNTTIRNQKKKIKELKLIIKLNTYGSTG